MPEKTKRPPVSDAGADATELTTAAPIAYRSVSGGMRLLRLTVVGPSAGVYTAKSLPCGSLRKLARTRSLAAYRSGSEGGTTPDGASRVVSLHDRDARPIAKGRLGKPVEFGYKGQIVDNDDGIVVDHQMHAENPADAPQLAPAIQRIKARTGRAPRTVTADRGYGEAATDQALTELGVRTVVIPRNGRPGAARQHVEKRPAFRRTIKWRTGCEGRISTLKRGYGWDRTRLDSLEGAKTWTGQGVFTHNLTRIAALTA